MACRKPKKPWVHKTKRTLQGKRIMSWTAPAYDDIHNWRQIELRCKKCLDCKLKQSAETGLRVEHELLSFGDDNMFCTFTVAPEHMEKVFPNEELSVRPMQLFNKKLRKKFKGVHTVINPITGKEENPIRILYCGEYGEKNFRPHYHAIIFNFKFTDLEPCKKVGDIIYYQSKTMQELWPYGHVTIGEANYTTGGYVGRYTAKKYQQKDIPELQGKREPFIIYPARWGLGRIFYEKWNKNLYDLDYTIIRKPKPVNARGNTKPFKVKPPKYYDRIHAEAYPEEMEKIVNARIERGSKSDSQEYGGNARYKTYRQLVKQRVKQAKLDLTINRNL